MRLLILGLAALTMIPVAGNAQIARTETVSLLSAKPGTATNHVVSGPTIESAAIGVQRAPSNVVDASGRSKAPRRSAAQHNMALVVVGAGAMVAGSFIDGTAGTMFMVGGAIIGLYGLFHLLQ